MSPDKTSLEIGVASRRYHSSNTLLFASSWMDELSRALSGIFLTVQSGARCDNRSLLSGVVLNNQPS
jgi:hypothetical protein